MASEIPACKNRDCPRFGSNKEVIILKETASYTSFGCKVCLGVNVQVTDWRQASQVNTYAQRGRPEYARERAFFFQGRNHRPISR